MSNAASIRPTSHHPAAHAHRPATAGSGAGAFAATLDSQFRIAAPDGPGKGTPAAHNGAAAAAGAPSACVAGTALGRFVGHSTGSGQCVALVRAAHPGLGPTAHWVRGAAVQGNTSLQPGTPIATFSASGHYANATNGSSHAAIYLSQTAHGVQVLDQWAGKPASVRTIPWSHPGATAANTGAAFHVVQSRSA